jgi:hypothetical protein
MSKKSIPMEIKVGVYYYIDDETKQPVFDTDEMRNEFEQKLKEIEDETEFKFEE